MVVVQVVKMLTDADGGANDGEDEDGSVDGRGLASVDADEPNAAAAAHEEVNESVDVALPSQAEGR